MAQIQNMGFTDVQAYAALKKGGVVANALDYLLSLSDAAKDKLGDEIVNDDTVSDNQQQGSGNVDTAAIPDAPDAPDAPDYKKDIYNKYTSNNNNNSDDNTNNTNVVVIKEFWCFEKNMIIMFKSLLVLFRGHKKTTIWLKKLLSPFQNIVNAPSQFPVGNNYEKEEIKDEEVKKKDEDIDKTTTFFEGFSNNNDDTSLPPWFEGFYHSGLAENAPGTAMIIKADKQQYGSTLSGSTFDHIRNINFDFTGITYVNEDIESPKLMKLNDKGRKTCTIVKGILKSSSAVEPISLIKDRENGILVGWHAKNDKYSAMYGRKCVKNQYTCISNISSSEKNILKFFTKTKKYIFIHTYKSNVTKQ